MIGDPKGGTPVPEHLVESLLEMFKTGKPIYGERIILEYNWKTGKMTRRYDT